MKNYLFSGIGGDDGEQLVFAQHFDWGYAVRNPPLYTWITILSQEIFGISSLAVNAVKILVLFLLYFFLFKLSLLVLRDVKLAVLSALSPLLIFHIAWDSILGFSHSVLAATLYLGTLFALFKLDNKNNILSYLMFGVAVGLGVLSKYSYVFFITTIFTTAIFDTKLRGHIYNPKILLSLLTAAIISFWHLVWLYDRNSFMTAELSLAFPPQELATRLISIFKGMLSSIKAIIGFLLPLIIILIIFFTNAWKLKVGSSDSETIRYYNIFCKFFIILFIFILLFIILGGISRVRTHYMFIMIPFPILFFLRVKMMKVEQRHILAYTNTLIATAIIILIGLPLKYLIEPSICGKCEHHLPYKEVADKIKSSGFSKGLIFAYWHPYPIAGNMRIQFPSSRIISAKHPTVIPTPKQNNRFAQCLLIWSGAAKGPQANNTIRLAKEHLNIKLDAGTKAQEINTYPLGSSKKIFSLGYIILNSEKFSCSYKN